MRAPIAGYVRDEHYGYLKIIMRRDQRRTEGFTHARATRTDPYQRALRTLGKEKLRAGK